MALWMWIVLAIVYLLVGFLIVGLAAASSPHSGVSPVRNISIVIITIFFWPLFFLWFFIF